MEGGLFAWLQGMLPFWGPIIAIGIVLLLAPIAWWIVRTVIDRVPAALAPARGIAPPAAPAPAVPAQD